MPRRKNPSAAMDTGTPERYQHLQSDDYRVETTDASKAGAKVRVRITTQSPIDRYLKRNEITRRQFDAGEQLYELHRMGFGSENITASFEYQIYSHTALTESQGHKIVKYNQAIRHLNKPEASCVISVCVYHQTSSDWARSKNQSPRSGIKTLRLGLENLADYWRL